MRRSTKRRTWTRRRIDVAASPGAIELRGWVPSPDQAVRAGQIAMEAAAPAPVLNRLSAGPERPADDGADDAEVVLPSPDAPKS